MAKFKIALCQHDVRDSVSENLRTAAESVRKAARRGADIAVLPEMFICHFVPAQMRFFAQTLSGDVVKALSKIAEENHIWLVGGSFPESGGENEQAWGPEPEIPYGSAPEDGVSSVSSSDAAVLYNTCPVFSPDGALQGSYRKRFLFDVDIPGKVCSCESVVFTPGDRSLIIDTGFVKFGVAICFDIRFPQIFIDMARDGADLIVVPAAFSARTGPDHWRLLNRARALDAQVFVAGADIAKNEAAPFAGHGGSCVSDPWGKIIAEAGDGEEIIIAQIDTDQVREIRQGLVVLPHQPTV